jgi:hypothetical protein
MDASVNSDDKIILHEIRCFVIVGFEDYRSSFIKNKNSEGNNEWSLKSEMACRQDM